MDILSEAHRADRVFVKGTIEYYREMAANFGVVQVEHDMNCWTGLNYNTWVACGEKAKVCHGHWTTKWSLFVFSGQT